MFNRWINISFALSLSYSYETKITRFVKKSNYTLLPTLNCTLNLENTAWERLKYLNIFSGNWSVKKTAVYN